MAALEDQDFDFSEEDFHGDFAEPPRPSEKAASEGVDDRVAQSRSEKSDKSTAAKKSRQSADLQEPAPAPKPKKSMTVIYVAGGLFVLVLVGSLGLVGYTLLGQNQAPQGQPLLTMRAQQPRMQQANDPRQSISVVEAPNLQDSDNFDAFRPQPQPAVAALQARQQAPSAAQAAPASPGVVTQREQGGQSEDDLYDAMLAQTPDDKINGQLIVPSSAPAKPVAVASAPAPATDSLANSQVLALIEEMKQSNKNVQAAVANLQGQVAAVQSQTAQMDARTAALGEQVKSLGVQVADNAKATDAKIAAVKEATAAAVTEARKAQQAKKNNGLVLAGGPITPVNSKVDDSIKPAASADGVASRPAPIQQAVPRQVSAPAEKLEGCPIKELSSNWHIKGITPTAAFIRRIDGAGTMVKEGMEVPGFGLVRSIDSKNRVICTTAGMIVRGE